VRRSPIARRTPLKPGRATLSRSRIVARPRPKPAAHKRHHERIAAMPCIACSSWPVEVHHVIYDGSARITRDHRLVLPLCPRCHRTGPTAVHVIGSAAWNELHGIDQLALATSLWGAEL
jgi:hypothetical protein